MDDGLPYKSPAGRLAWDFNSNRPFDPQAVLALLNSDAKSLHHQGQVSGPGWTGTGGKPTYTADFTFSDFGIGFSVAPPPESQVNHDTGVGALQF